MRPLRPSVLHVVCLFFSKLSLSDGPQQRTRRQHFRNSMGEQRERAVRCERWDPSEIRGLTVMCAVLGGGSSVQRFLLPVQMCNPTLQASIITDQRGLAGSMDLQATPGIEIRYLFVPCLLLRNKCRSYVGGEDKVGRDW